MEWNYDLASAPTGRHEMVPLKSGFEKVFVPEFVQTASNCGKVIVTYKLECGRWNCYAKNEQPIAWAPLLKHPAFITPEAA